MGDRAWGRLDVTNIVLPVVSVITNVGHDHTDVLGDTLEKIAFEKAGIIKPGVPVVSCVSQPEVIAVLKERAEACRTKLYLAGEDFSYELAGIEEGVQSFNFKGPFRDLQVGIAMKGEHQLSNAAVAMMALEVLRQYMAFMLDDEDVLQGFKDTFGPDVWRRSASIRGSYSTARIIPKAQRAWPEACRSFTSTVN